MKKVFILFSLFFISSFILNTSVVFCNEITDRINKTDKIISSNQIVNHIPGLTNENDINLKSNVEANIKRADDAIKSLNKKLNSLMGGVRKRKKSHVEFDDLVNSANQNLTDARSFFNKKDYLNSDKKAKASLEDIKKAESVLIMKQEEIISTITTDSYDKNENLLRKAFKNIHTSQKILDDIDKELILVSAKKSHVEFDPLFISAKSSLEEAKAYYNDKKGKQAYDKSVKALSDANKASSLFAIKRNEIINTKRDSKANDSGTDEHIEPSNPSVSNNHSVSDVTPVIEVPDKSDDIKGNIENIKDRILEVQNRLKTSVWKDKDGKFNKHRLLSDSIAGVVLGTAGGLITSTVMKKVQVKNGYEDIQCTINGQSVASYGDEFRVGIK